MKLLLVALAVFLVNVPFGYWRATTRTFSWQWIAAVHFPVPVVVALRMVSHLGFRLWTFPVMVGAYFLGQWVGGTLNAALRASPRLSKASGCLVADLARMVVG